MSILSIKELPPPPAGKTGWPWTEGGDPLPELLPDGSAWPSLVLVTASYNQAAYLEQAIRSVLLQGYPALSYYVQDGGSTDGSVEIIKKYEPWLSGWVSEPDAGPAQAINRVLLQHPADVLGWLNADDFYAPQALQILMNCRAAQPESAAWLGSCQMLDGEDNPVRVRKAEVTDQESLAYWFDRAAFQQPASLFSGTYFAESGGLDEQLKCFFDVALWIKLAGYGPFSCVEEIVANARLHEEAISFKWSDLQTAEWIATTYAMGFPDAAVARVRQVIDRAVGKSLPEVRAKLGDENLLRQFTCKELIAHLVKRLTKIKS